MSHPRMAATAARADFARLMTRVFKGERVIVERAGGVAVAMISADDLARLELLEDRADVEAARVAMAEPGPNLTQEEFKRKHGL